MGLLVRMLTRLERVSLEMFSERANEVAPVFIVGLPRSGTTLLYQLLLNYFDWSYFTRWTETFYRTPVVAYRLQRLAFPEPRHFEYTSYYGKFRRANLVSKAWSPVEGNPIWRRWFPERPTHCYEGNLGAAAKKEMQWIIGAFITISGEPFLNKNGAHSLRLLPLWQVFPKSLFIVIKRQSLYVAQSLYIARTRPGRKNPKNTWWGTKPREYEYLKDLDPLKQAVGQTKAIEATMESQLLCNDRHIEVNYQDVCEQPGKVVQRIHETCLKFGIDLRRMNDVEPEPFSLADERKVPEREFNEIKSLLETF